MAGGAEEIGANCCYLDLDGTGIFIDAGLHPRDRTERVFPSFDAIADRPTDLALITHAHTDHVGALPYLLRRFPHVRPVMTFATRDLTHIMLPNGAKLLRAEMQGVVPKDWLDFYDRNEIDRLRMTFEAIRFDEPQTYRGYRGRSDVVAQYSWAGHILGSASVLLDCKGFSVLHTGDIHFEDQTVVPGAHPPRRHVDVLITEATNGAIPVMPSLQEETDRLARFINMITERNGSVLIPCFALGKMQEMIVLLYDLMRRGVIPHLPIHTGGMGTRISKVYDQYCYDHPMLRPGAEISDVPQEKIFRNDLDTGDYFKRPSIVVASSGMMNRGTISYELALLWMTKPTYGIAFIGYQHPSTPGHDLMVSPKNEPFDLAGRRTRRVCEVERFRFTSHASREGLVSLINDTTPSTVVIVHGEPEACEELALAIRDQRPGTRIIIPRAGVPYDLRMRPGTVSVE